MARNTTSPQPSAATQNSTQRHRSRLSAVLAVVILAAAAAGTMALGGSFAVLEGADVSAKALYDPALYKLAWTSGALILFGFVAGVMVTVFHYSIREAPYNPTEVFGYQERTAVGCGLLGAFLMSALATMVLLAAKPTVGAVPLQVMCSAVAVASLSGGLVMLNLRELRDAMLSVRVQKPETTDKT